MRDAALAAGDTAAAAVVSDLVGKHGLTDKHIADLTRAWNAMLSADEPIEGAEESKLYGPRWRDVMAVIRQAGELKPEQFDRCVSSGFARTAARTAAWLAADEAARAAGREDAWKAARRIARRRVGRRRRRRAGRWNRRLRVGHGR